MHEHEHVHGEERCMTKSTVRERCMNKSTVWERGMNMPRLKERCRYKPRGWVAVVTRLRREEGIMEINSKQETKPRRR